MYALVKISKLICLGALRLLSLATPDIILWEINSVPKRNQDANIKVEKDTEEPQTLDMSTPWT